MASYINRIVLMDRAGKARFFVRRDRFNASPDEFLLGIIVPGG